LPLCLASNRRRGRRWPFPGDSLPLAQFSPTRA
jgi:hypothetical protein